MTYETILRPPVLHDVYRTHQWLEGMFKAPGTDVPRSYTWTTHGDCVLVRHPDPEDKASWTPVEIPPAGSLIRFQLNAHVRKGPDRRSNLDEGDNLTWFERLSDRIGIVIRDVEFGVIKLPIAKPERPYFLSASRFEGIATIENPRSLEEPIRTGIANAKAYSLGFFLFHKIR